jgi:hypothetical protein
MQGGEVMLLLLETGLVDYSTSDDWKWLATACVG